MEGSDVPPLLRPGDRCDLYEVVSSLGTSRAAELYLARRPGGEPCVLKMMSAPGAEKQRLRFAQEGVVLAKILHANVVRVFGAGTRDERVWLAIERFGDETLGDRLRAGGPPPLDDLLGWAQQVCSGLIEAHRLGIVHRNLAPDSVVLGPGGLVKLGEFGTAKLAEFGVVTTAEQQIGCSLYAAPEQLRGAKEIDSRADVYGLGVLLYEAIAGVRPMGPGPYNTWRVVNWHVREQARPLGEQVPGLPAGLEALVHQMLEKDPAKRPASAQEVHDRLRDARVGERAELLREVRNAAPVERQAALAPTQPMAAVPGRDGGSPQTPGVTPPGGARTTVLPAPVPAATTPPLVPPPLVAPPLLPPPAAPSFGQEAPGEVRATGEPVESEARRSRPVSRWGALVAGGVLALAAGGTIGWTLSGGPTGPAQGAGSASPVRPASAPPVSPPAPRSSAAAPTASAATPRAPGAGTSKRPGPAAPRPPGPTPRAKN